MRGLTETFEKQSVDHGEFLSCVHPTIDTVVSGATVVGRVVVTFPICLVGRPVVGFVPIVTEADPGTKKNSMRKSEKRIHSFYLFH